MKYNPHEDLPVFVKWYEFLKWLFPVTEKFPKRIRYTFAERIDNLAIDIIENIIEARYSKNKKPILKNINLQLEKMRIFLRLCHDLRYLSYNSYEHAMRSINETGRMIGGWIKDKKNETNSQSF